MQLPISTTRSFLRYVRSRSPPCSSVSNTLRDSAADRIEQNHNQPRGNRAVEFFSIRAVRDQPAQFLSLRRPVAGVCAGLWLSLHKRVAHTPPPAGTSSRTAGLRASRARTPRPRRRLEESRLRLSLRAGVSEDDLEFVSTHAPHLYRRLDWLRGTRRLMLGERPPTVRSSATKTAMTAAHRTLPMGSLVVVKNLKDRPVRRDADYRSWPVC